MPENDSVQFNKQVHDQVSRVYERRHTEIFNPIEQHRLRESLRTAVGQIKTASEQFTALDFGCGSGNLTKHLIDLDLKTTSADLSDRFLALITEKFTPTGLSQTLKLNGVDLANIPDEQFDFVATYSVLHHVPDYLRIVEEMCRVLKPGGVIYIDHEVTESYWDRPPQYIEFLKAAKPRINLKRCIRLLLDVPGYIHIIRRLLNPRYKREGDIHVWPDDHIEWDKIEKTLHEHNFEIVLKEDYLLCKGLYKQQVYDRYKTRCADQRTLAARKSPK